MRGHMLRILFDINLTIVWNHKNDNVVQLFTQKTIQSQLLPTFNHLIDPLSYLNSKNEISFNKRINELKAKLEICHLKFSFYIRF